MILKSFPELPTIGNDIVDLTEEQPPLHSRYIDRVFTAHEQKSLGSDRSKLWLNWAAKEAAFKAISRIFPTTVFAPLEFELISDSQISFKAYLLHNRFILTEQYAFSHCCSLNPENTINWISELPSSSTEHSSLIREFALKKLSEYYGESDIEISLATRKNCPPTVMLSGRPLNAVLSFSHHGKFIACSLLNHK